MRSLDSTPSMRAIGDVSMTELSPRSNYDAVPTAASQYTHIALPPSAGVYRQIHLSQVDNNYTVLDTNQVSPRK
jgi:hypothetical protein